MVALKIVIPLLLIRWGATPLCLSRPNDCDCHFRIYLWFLILYSFVMSWCVFSQNENFNTIEEFWCLGNPIKKWIFNIVMAIIQTRIGSVTCWFTVPLLSMVNLFIIVYLIGLGTYSQYRRIFYLLIYFALKNLQNSCNLFLFIQILRTKKERKHRTFKQSSVATLISSFGWAFHVTRQIIVQDIACLELMVFILFNAIRYL